MRCRLVVSLSLMLLFLSTLPAMAEVEELVATIQAVGPEGKGNEAAKKAWKKLVDQNALFPTLKGLSSSGPRAQNWFRAAVDAIVQNIKADKKDLPTRELENYILKNPDRGPGRKLAFDLLVDVDPNAKDRLLPILINDPSSGLRREAIAYEMDHAAVLLKEEKKGEAKALYQKLMPRARDEDQVKAIAKALKPLGVEVDLTKHFGFITSWYLITPFDNRKGVGYDKAYPPEMEIKLDKTYDGKEDAKAKWTTTTTKDPLGVVDLNTVLDKHKGAVAYAYVVIESPKDQPVEVRAGSVTALKMFLNGKEIFAREEYHHGIRIDQYSGFGRLKKGRNELLLKVCQNEQTENWAQKWQFQVRLCDHLGGAIPFKVVAPVAKAGAEGGAK